ncbi:MAG: hypothetical protein K9W44_10065 [Candidatus Lokiarchaeota archaeon]|nr:hypothetical protein [Candidatus Harpocratesius repetitus]
MSNENTKITNIEKNSQNVLTQRLSDEKIIRSFFIPYRTTSLFGFIIWILLLLFPIILLIISNRSDDISKNTQIFLDVVLGIWIIFMISLLFFIGYGKKYLILTNKRVIYKSEYNLLFLKKFRMIREFSTKISDVLIVERNQYRYPDIQIMILGGFMLLTSVVFWIFEKVADIANILTVQESNWLNLTTITTLAIGGVLLLLNVFFFSRKHFKVVLVIGQTFPLPKIMGRFFSFNAKSGYWVIGGHSKDAKKMYEQFHNLLFEMQESYIKSTKKDIE